MGFNYYNLGDRPKLVFTCKDHATDELTDPESFSITVLAPDDTLATKVYGTDADVLQDTTGIITLTVDANQSGTWFYYGYATGTWQGADERRFVVRPSQVAEAMES